MSLGWKQVPLLYAKDVGEVLNLLVGRRTPLSLDVGEHIARHVAPQKLQPSDELILCPIPLITEFGGRRTLEDKAEATRASSLVHDFLIPTG